MENQRGVLEIKRRRIRIRIELWPCVWHRDTAHPPPGAASKENWHIGATKYGYIGSEK